MVPSVKGMCTGGVMRGPSKQHEERDTMHRMISVALVAVLAACAAQAQDVARVAELTAKVDSTLRRINARTESTRTPGLGASVRMEMPAARVPEQQPASNTPAGEGAPAKPLTIEDRLAALETAPRSEMSPEVTQLLGDLRKAVDAVIGPLNVAAEYVDRISKGDIPAKITDNYNGDFNEIKNNLNQAIDAVNALVADASHAVEGGRGRKARHTCRCNEASG